MEFELKIMILFLLVSLTISCVQFLVAKHKSKALGYFIFPISLAVLTMIAAVIT